MNDGLFSWRKNVVEHILLVVQVERTSVFKWRVAKEGWKINVEAWQS